MVHCKYRVSGGEETVVESDRRLLEEAGHKVFLYYRENTELDSLSTLNKIRSTLGYISSSSLKEELISLITDRHIDLIWVHNTLWMIGTAVYEAGLSCSVPVIQTIHNLRLICPNGLGYRETGNKGSECGYGISCDECVRIGLHRALIHGCYRNSRALTAIITSAMKRQRKMGIYEKIRFACLTEAQKNVLLDAGIGIKAEQVFIKPNTVRIKNNRINYSDRENIFVYAGRLEEIKGIKELLEAWRRLEKEVYINANASDNGCPRLVICGEGKLSGYVRKFVSDNAMDYVNYKGRLSREEVSDILKKAKALIYPTKFFEGQPMAVTEAFAVGTPAIVPDWGNAGAMVSDGINGIHIDHLNMVASLVDIIKKWDALFAFDEAKMCQSAERYSEERNREALNQILDTI